jgi:hypothetical protein
MHSDESLTYTRISGFGGEPKIGATVVGDGKVTNLNEQSIQELKSIKSTMIDKKIKVDDLQFLVDEKGHVKISDPAAVHTNTTPSTKNLKMIDLLIQQAQKNVDSRGRENTR